MLDDETLRMLVSSETTKVTFCLCWTSIHNSSITYISSTCSESLTSLTMSHCPLVDDSALECLSSCRKLKVLSLECAWKISDKGLKSVITNCKITSLRLSNMPSITLDWSDTFWQNCSQLLFLHIVGCIGITQKFIDNIPEDIPSLSLYSYKFNSLTNLDRPTNFQKLAQKVSNSLEQSYIDIQHRNYISKQAFESSLPYLPNLKVVKCALGSVQLLSEHCPLVEVLQTAHLPSSDDRAFSEIGQCLERFKHLHTLLISRTKFEEYFNAIKDRVQYLSLTTIWTGISIQKLLLQMPQLKLVDLPVPSNLMLSGLGQKTLVYEEGMNQDEWIQNTAEVCGLSVEVLNNILAHEYLKPIVNLLQNKRGLRISFGLRQQIEDWGYFTAF